MSIKDFKVGQAVFILRREHIYSLRESYKIIETVVSKVGRKYVTISNGTQFLDDSEFRGEQNAKDEFRNRLVENKDWGYPDFLFRTRKAAEEYIEHNQLCVWITRLSKVGMSNDYTLEQLRQVKAILDPGGGNHGCKTESD